MNQHERDLIAKLADQPGWAALKTSVADKREKVFHQLAIKLMAGADIPDAEVAEARGFFKGMEFLLREPAMSVKAIEKELAKEADTSGEEE